MTVPYPELILAALLFITGRYLLPAIAFLAAIPGATPQQRGKILEQMVRFFRGHPRTDQTPDDDTPDDDPPPKPITGPK